MIKIENVEVFGWEAAIRGMRNPKNSWDKSDSDLGMYCDDCTSYSCDGCACLNGIGTIIGENDLRLMKTLAKAGSDHGKFLRMINVTCDITAPLYWWKEFDTYKVGTVANSCSTMHKITAKEFTLEDFSHEHLIDNWNGDNCEAIIYGELDEPYSPLEVIEKVIEALNVNRQAYLHTKTKPMKNATERAELMKRYWWQMIQLLPSSYNQKRTVQLNYEVLRAMDRPGRRRDHKLDEWREFCKWAETLPYFKEICIDVH